jgi:hypothetical protein
VRFLHFIRVVVGRVMSQTLEDKTRLKSPEDTVVCQEPAYRRKSTQEGSPICALSMNSKGKAVPLHAMEALGGRGGLSPIHSRPRH